MPPQAKRLDRADFRSPQLVEKKKRKRKQTLLILLFVVIFILAAIATVLSLPSLRIQSVVVEGQKVIDKKELEKFISGELSGKMFYLFPKDSIILYHNLHLSDDILGQFSRAEYAGLELTNRTTLKVTIRERGGRYLWCGDDPTITIDSCYFVDSKGFIFSEAPYFSDNVYLKIYGTLATHKDGVIGSTILPQDEFNKLVSFRDVLYSHDIPVVGLNLKSDGDYELLLAHASDGIATAPVIYFNSKDDLSTTLNNLLAALSNDPLKSDFKQKYSTLLYLDARYDNKIFFKFKQAQ